jgi:hypothetical protein
MPSALAENLRWDKTVEESRLSNWSVLDRLAPVILGHVPGCVVDIGAGESTEVLLRHTKELGRTHYTVDKNQWILGLIMHSGWAHSDHYAWSCSSEYFMLTFDEPVALVLLDGGHKYTTVKRESEFFLQRLTPGGVLFIHDTMPWENAYRRMRKQMVDGVQRHLWMFRKELELKEDVDVLTWPYTAAYCGLTMVMKKDMTRPEFRR